MSDSENEVNEINEEIQRLSVENPNSIQAKKTKKEKRAYTISEEDRIKKAERMHEVRKKRDENAQKRKQEYEQLKEQEAQKAKVELAKKLDKEKKKILKTTKKETIKTIMEDKEDKSVSSASDSSEEEIYVYKKPQKRISRGKKQIKQLISPDDTSEFESESEYEQPPKPRARARPKKKYVSETSESEYEPRSPRKSVPRKSAAPQAPNRFNPNLVHRSIF